MRQRHCSDCRAIAARATSFAIESESGSRFRSDALSSREPVFKFARRRTGACTDRRQLSKVKQTSPARTASIAYAPLQTSASVRVVKIRALWYRGRNLIFGHSAMKPKLTMTDAPEPGARDAIVGPLIAFNNSRASQPESYRPLVITLSDSDIGKTLGGLWGATNFSFLRIDLLFVPEGLRGTGLGRTICFKRSKKRLRGIVMEHGWIRTAFKHTRFTNGSATAHLACSRITRPAKAGYSCANR